MQKLGSALEQFTGKAWSRQAVWDAEQGRRAFTAAELLALAGALNVTLPQLLETSESVTMPSGATLPPSSVDALLAGTNRDKDRTMKLRNELRGLRRLHGQIIHLSTVFAVQIARLDRALNGAPDPAEWSGNDALSYLVRMADEQAQKWAEPDTQESYAETNLSFEEDQ